MRRFAWPALTVALLAASCAIPATGLIALDDRASVESGGQVTIPVLLNDRPPPGELMWITGVQGAAGDVRIAADGSLVYNAAEGFSGDDFFSYFVRSETSEDVKASVFVSVATEPPPAEPIPDPPVVDFGEVEVGSDPAVDEVRFTNPGPGSIGVGAPFIEPGGSPDFDVIDSDCGRDLPEGDSCVALLAFRPISPGPQSAMLALDDAPRVALHGIGVVNLFTGCTGFEDLPVDTTFHVGDVFVTSDIQVDVLDFTHSSGKTTSNGFAMVEPGDPTAGSGQDMEVNNVLLRFSFGSVIEGLSLNFGEYGGTLNLEINTEFFNIGSMSEMDGVNIGGVDVRVFASDVGSNEIGSIILLGIIDSFGIGGQELRIDDVCTPPTSF